MSDYAFVHDGKAFTPNQTSIEADKAAEHNKAIELAELARWDTKPDTQLAYYHFPSDYKARAGKQWLHTYHPLIYDAYVTLWPGNMIGTITSARVYTHNFGGRFVSLSVRGTNGAIYHGRASWDNGTCINLHKSKA